MKQLALLSATILVFFRAHLVDSSGEYAIVAPELMRTEQNFDVCVIIMKPNGTDVTVEMSVLTSPNDAVLVTKKVKFKPGTENTVSLKIPKTTSNRHTLLVEGSGGITFTKQARIRVITTNVIILIQTDKAIYRPGQKVLIRVMGLNVDLKPYTGTFKITITDKAGNKLRESKEKNTNGRDCEFIYSDEFQLADVPPLGNWKITAKTETNEILGKSFRVEEYVLPKVEVKVLLGSFYHHTMKTLVATIQAKYTFGQPVEGSVRVEIHFEQYYPKSKLYFKIVKVADLVNGNVKVKVTQKDILSLYKSKYCSGKPQIHDYPYSSSYIVFKATVTESITGDKYKSKNRIQSKRSLLAMKFMTSSPKNYKPNLVWTGFIKLTRADGGMLLENDRMDKDGKKLQVEVRLSYKDYLMFTQKLEKKFYDVPHDGLVMIEFRTQGRRFHSVNIYAEYPPQSTTASGAKTVTSSYVVKKYISRNREGIQLSMPYLDGVIEPSNKPVKFQIDTTEQISSFYYQIISKRRIIKKGKQTASGKVNTFTVLFNKAFSHKASPSAKVVVWYISGKELLIDSIQISVDGTFINEISLSLSKKKVGPGDKLTVSTKTDQQSCVGLLALDKSVLLLKQGNDITEDNVVDKLYKFDASHIKVYRKKRSIWWWWWYPVYVEGSDPKEIIENAGLVILTDAYIHNEPRRVIHDQRIFSFGYDALLPLQPRKPSGGSSTNTDDTDDVRDVFPETWLWMNLFSGNDGSAKTDVEAPDTITSWVFSAFSINKKSGLGFVDKPKELIVFKSCFTDLRLPYFAIRNEILELRAIVFNYLDTTQTIKVTLVQSPNRAFYAEKKKDKDPVKVQAVVKTIKIRANDGKEVNFYIKPVKLGEVTVQVGIKSNDCSDALEKKLLVEAEGEPCDYSKGLYYGLENTSESDTVKIVFPSDVVEGSERIVITATGDVMGPSAKHLDHLIKEPYGCAEQNLVTFAPNIYVLDYLNAAELGSKALKAQAVRFMEIGYQRELAFQRTDGSFSAFGQNDAAGSLWMTAFVLRCFQQAKPYVTMDQNVIDKATRFIVGQQQRDGRFKEPTGSKIYHSNLQGSAFQGVALTAFVSKVLREIVGDLDNSVKKDAQKAINKAAPYLEKLLNNVRKNAYILSVTCYVLCDSKSKKAYQCLKYLEKLAIKLDGRVHWESRDRTQKYKYWRPPYFLPLSNTVEMTAYALLTYCLKGDTDKAVPIALWLATMRTSYGGYRSTQDTVIGLQALATYAAKFPSSTRRGVDVKLRWKGGKYKFNTIRTSNSDVLQQFQMPSAGSLKTIAVEADGSGTALVQVHVFFNKNSTVGASGFKLTVTTVITDLMVKVKVCVVYSLEQSGMVVIEINMLTSYLPLLDEIMGQHKDLKKVEYRGKRLVLYFDTITAIKVCVTIKVRSSVHVGNLKPAVIQVYSYYESNVRASSLYLPGGEVSS